MRKQQLSGTLEEQCEFLYQLSQEKMAQGNYSGAYHALKEILKYAPDHEHAQQLFEVVKQKKAEQRKLLFMGLLGAIVFVGVGTLFELSNDLIFILLAIIGLIVGFFVGNLLLSRRSTSTTV